MSIMLWNQTPGKTSIMDNEKCLRFLPIQI